MVRAVTRFALLAAATNAYQLGVASLVAHRRDARVVLQEPPDVANANEMEPEGVPGQPEAATVEVSSYLAKEKAKYGVSDVSDASTATDDDGTRVAVPSFFGKREEERPGAALGKEGLNEQGYDPYDAKAVDSSTLDTKPVFIALALATVAIGALSASNSIF